MPKQQIESIQFISGCFIALAVLFFAMSRCGSAEYFFGHDDAGGYPFVIPMTELSCLHYHLRSGEVFGGFEFRQPTQLVFDDGTENVSIRDILFNGTQIPEFGWCTPIVMGKDSEMISR